MSEKNTNKADSAEYAAQPLLEVKNLQVQFETSAGTVKAVRDANFTVYPGQWVAIVGESGSGKSTSAMSVLNLLPGTGHIVGGSIKLDGKELTSLSKKEYVALRGRKIGLVPQDPMSNLNPVWKIGTQIKESLKANNIDVSREMRSKFVSAFEREENGDNSGDDELFLGSEYAAALFREAEKAVKSAKNNDKETKKILDEFKQSWNVGSITRWHVRADLVKAGVEREKAAKIAAKYVTGATESDRIAGLLSEAGLPDAAVRSKQYPHEFSGGMRQRALIAMGLAARPELLIADEPTSALDVTVQKKILDHLRSLTDALGTAVLFITHDLGLAAERADHIVVMYKGQVVESGPGLEVLQHPLHPYTKKLVSAAPSLASRRLSSVRERVKNDAKKDSKDAKSDEIIKVSNLVKEFKVPGKKEMFKAVNDVSFSVKRGTTCAIVGESGSGKSTVANMILQLFSPDSGKILYEGKNTADFNKKELLDFRRHVQPVFQNPYGSLDPSYTIYRSIEEPLRVHGIRTKEERVDRVRKLLKMVDLPEAVMTRYPNELSGGQRQRIAIARAMALNPDVIVCDEAVSALDVLVQDQILRLLNDLQKERGISYLFITHDLAVVRQIADDVVVMQRGRLVEHADTDSVFSNPKTQYTRDLLDAIPGGKLKLGLD